VLVELGAVDGAVESVLLQPASAQALANEAIKKKVRMVDSFVLFGFR